MSTIIIAKALLRYCLLCFFPKKKKNIFFACRHRRCFGYVQWWCMAHTHFAHQPTISGRIYVCSCIDDERDEMRIHWKSTTTVLNWPQSSSSFDKEYLSLQYVTPRNTILSYVFFHYNSPFVWISFRRGKLELEMKGWTDR